MNVVPTINLKLETRTVQYKIIKTKWEVIYEEPTFGMSVAAYNWYLIKIKTNNFIKRLLKNK